MNPNFPAILVGDLNSDPGIARTDGDPTSGAVGRGGVGIITGAGFTDSGNTENTFGHDSNVNDFPSNMFNERIDHVLTRGRSGLVADATTSSATAARRSTARRAASGRPTTVDWSSACKRRVDPGLGRTDSARGSRFGGGLSSFQAACESQGA